MTSPREGDDAPDPPRTIERQLALGFGLVALLATLMCGMLMALVEDVGETVEHMREDEASVRKGLALATATREQYIHIAHSMIEGDRSHLDHYTEWVDGLAADADALRPNVPPTVAWRLDALLDDARAMDELFRGTLLPAAEHGMLASIRAEHTRVERISGEAAAHADAIAIAVEQRMAAEHEAARRSIRLGSLVGALCVAAVIGLAIGYTLRLRAAVLQPLAALTAAARRFAGGEFAHRVGDLGHGEILQVSRALDRMAEELARREARLVEAERMAAIGQLAAGMAHEMNNPIGIIRGYVKTMLPEAESDRLREELRIVDEEASVCQRLAEDLLAYAHTPPLRLESVDIAELVHDLARRAEELPGVEAHSVRADVETSTIVADPVRLRQVLTNLVLNAAQASPVGSPIDLVGRVATEGGYTISVRDRGPGVDPADRPRIFEPFFSKRRGGSGLGLAVSRGIVRAHGGTLTVESAPDGPGAVFHVRLRSTAATAEESGA